MLKRTKAFGLAFATCICFGLLGMLTVQPQPVAASSVNPDLFFVGDARGLVHALFLSGARLDSVRTRPADGPVWSICSMNGSLYLQTPTWNSPVVIRRLTWADSTVHEVRIPGTVDGQNPFMACRRSMGRVACLDESETVVFLPEIVPDIRAFTEDGSIAWTVRVPVYDSLRMRVENDGVIQEFEIPHHTGLGVTPLPSGRALVQVAYHTSSSVKDRLPYAWIENYLLDPADRRIEAIGRSRLVVSWADSERVAGVVGHPVPKVKVFRRHPHPGPP